MCVRGVVVVLALALVRSALAASLVVGPYLQAPRPDGVVVAWETDQPSTGAVLVQTEGAAVLRIDASGLATRHEVSVAGLPPASFHRYRVLVDEQPQGEPGVLVTLPLVGDPLTFAVFGDTRSDADAHAACIAALGQHPIDFAVHTGDLVGSGEIEAEWTEFFRLEAPLIREVPIFPVVGNHDEDGGELTAPYLRLFVPPPSGREHEATYSFRAGNAHFVVLDSQTSVLPEFICTQVILWWDACLDEAQRAWLEADLAAAAADPTVEHVFVFAHEGPYSSKPGRSGWAELRWLLPWFAQNKVSAIFSGHDHLYEHGRSVNGLEYVVSGGGGAPLYESVPEESIEEHPREVLRTEVTYNFQIVEVEGADVRVRTYECDGSLLEAFELRAAAPCAEADDCEGGAAGTCPGDWACDQGRCRWACDDEPECVAAPMCAHREPGQGPGRWACVKGACAWEPGAAAEVEPAEADARNPEPASETADPGREASSPEASAAEIGEPAPEPTSAGGGSCALSSWRGAQSLLPMLLGAALVLLRVRRSRCSR